jgi:hypothetical protein
MQSVTLDDAEAAHWAGFDNRLHTVWEPIVDFGLQRHVAELDVLGYTVLEPSDPSVVHGMREAVFDIAERQWGPGARDGSVFEESPRDTTPVMQPDIVSHPVFVDAICDPRAVALVRYLCGYNALFYGCDAFYKGKGQRTYLHLDSEGSPEPLPEWDDICGAAWLLTDVRFREDGALSFVPGSHQFRRRPTQNDDRLAEQRAVPVLADAGSVVIFRGSTWHCTPRKETGGIRAHVRINYQRFHPRFSARVNVKVPDHLIEAAPAETRHVLITPPNPIDLITDVYKNNEVFESEAAKLAPEAVARVAEYEQRYRSGAGSRFL